MSTLNFLTVSQQIIRALIILQGIIRIQLVTQTLPLTYSNLQSKHLKLVRSLSSLYVININRTRSSVYSEGFIITLDSLNLRAQKKIKFA